MVYLLEAIVVAFSVSMAWGAATGRVKVRTCCSADPRRDLRMRDAFLHEDTVAAGDRAQLPPVESLRVTADRP
jgi:hypothetical protein